MKTSEQSRPSLKEIMRVTGLSRATVDRALNGREGVHPLTQIAVDSALRHLAGELSASERVATTELKHYKMVIQAGSAFTQSMIDEIDSLQPLLHGRGCDIEVITCVSTANEQVAGIVRAQADADGLVIIAKNSPPIASAARELQERGKAIVTSHTDLDNASRNAYVGIDNRAAGQTAGFLMGRHMVPEEPANIAVVVETMFYRCCEEREMGFRSVLRQRFPNLNLIEVVKYDDSAEATYEAIKTLLDSYRSIEGIYNTSGGNQGVAKALAEFGRSRKTLFITHELNAVTESLIRSDAIDYLIAQNMTRMVLEAVDQLSNILTGNPYLPQIFIPLEILCRYSLPPVVNGT